MKIYFIFLAVLLAGCASTVWVGSNPRKDMAECELEAASRYSPVIYSEKISSGYRAPTYTYCNSINQSVNCNTMGGQYTPPITITSDANSSIRHKYINYCMNQRGNRKMTNSEYEVHKENEWARQAKALREAAAARHAEAAKKAELDRKNTTPKNIYFSTETPEKRRARLREECRKKHGLNTPLKDCI